MCSHAQIKSFQVLDVLVSGGGICAIPCVKAHFASPCHADLNSADWLLGLLLSPPAEDDASNASADDISTSSHVSMLASLIVAQLPQNDAAWTDARVHLYSSVEVLLADLHSTDATTDLKQFVDPLAARLLYGARFESKSRPHTMACALLRQLLATQPVSPGAFPPDAFSAVWSSVRDGKVKNQTQAAELFALCAVMAVEGAAGGGPTDAAEVLRCVLLKLEAEMTHGSTQSKARGGSRGGGGVSLSSTHSGPQAQTIWGCLHAMHTLLQAFPHFIDAPAEAGTSAVLDGEDGDSDRSDEDVVLGGAAAAAAAAAATADARPPVPGMTAAEVRSKVFALAFAMGTRIPEGWSRFQPTEAALDVVTSFAAQFGAALSSEAGAAVFVQLLRLVHSKHKFVSYKALPAAKAVLSSIGHASISKHTKGVFLRIGPMLLQMVQGHCAIAAHDAGATVPATSWEHKPAMDLDLAMSGIGSIAPWILQFDGPAAAAGVMARLLDAVESIVVGASGTADDEVEHTPEVTSFESGVSFELEQAAELASRSRVRRVATLCSAVSAVASLLSVTPPADVMPNTVPRAVQCACAVIAEFPTLLSVGKSARHDVAQCVLSLVAACAPQPHVQLRVTSDIAAHVLKLSTSTAAYAAAVAASSAVRGAGQWPDPHFVHPVTGLPEASPAFEFAALACELCHPVSRFTKAAVYHVIRRVPGQQHLDKAKQRKCLYELCSKLYDELVGWCVGRIPQLNLHLAAVSGGTGGRDSDAERSALVTASISGNFNMAAAADSGDQSAVQVAVGAAAPRDMETCVAVCDFLQILLPHTPAALFRRWQRSAVSAACAASAHAGHISGLYSLVSVMCCVAAAAAGGTAKGGEGGNGASADESSELAALDMATIHDFTRQTLARCAQHSPEMRAASLGCVLRTPLHVLKLLPRDQVRSLLSQAVCQACELHSSNNAVLLLALRSLHSWCTLDRPLVLSLLGAITPPLRKAAQSLLASPVQGGGEEGALGGAGPTATRRKTNTMRRRRAKTQRASQRNLMEQERSAVLALAEVFGEHVVGGAAGRGARHPLYTPSGGGLSSESMANALSHFTAQDALLAATDSRLRLRRALFLLLGALGDAGAALLDSAQGGVGGGPSQPDELQWGSTAPLLPADEVAVGIGCSGETLHLSIRRILPRSAALALTSAERGTRVAAIELTHGCVLAYLAAVHGRATMALPDSWLSLGQRVFDICLRVAASSESIAVQLFTPLLKQIANLMSTPGAATKWAPLAEVWFDALLASAGDGSSAAQGVTSAALGQSILWGLKCDLGGLTAPQARGAPSSAPPAQVAIDLVVTLAEHSSPSCRRVAALAFNQTYRRFREHQHLARRMAFRLAKAFLRAAVGTGGVGGGSGDAAAGSASGAGGAEGVEGGLHAVLGVTLRHLRRITHKYAPEVLQDSDQEGADGTAELGGLLEACVSALGCGAVFPQREAFALLDALVPAVQNVAGGGGGVDRAFAPGPVEMRRLYGEWSVARWGSPAAAAGGWGGVVQGGCPEWAKQCSDWNDDVPSSLLAASMVAAMAGWCTAARGGTLLSLSAGLHAWVGLLRRGCIAPLDMLQSSDDTPPMLTLRAVGTMFQSGILQTWAAKSEHSSSASLARPTAAFLFFSAEFLSTVFRLGEHVPGCCALLQGVHLLTSSSLKQQLLACCDLSVLGLSAADTDACTRLPAAVTRLLQELNKQPAVGALVTEACRAAYERMGGGGAGTAGGVTPGQSNLIRLLHASGCGALLASAVPSTVAGPALLAFASGQGAGATGGEVQAAQDALQAAVAMGVHTEGLLQECLRNSVFWQRHHLVAGQCFLAAGAGGGAGGAVPSTAQLLLGAAGEDDQHQCRVFEDVLELALRLHAPSAAAGGPLPSKLRLAAAPAATLLQLLPAWLGAWRMHAAAAVQAQSLQRCCRYLRVLGRMLPLCPAALACRLHARLHQGLDEHTLAAVQRTACDATCFVLRHGTLSDKADVMQGLLPYWLPGFSSVSPVPMQALVEVASATGNDASTLQIAQEGTSAHSATVLTALIEAADAALPPLHTPYSNVQGASHEGAAVTAVAVRLLELLCVYGCVQLLPLVCERLLVGAPSSPLSSTLDDALYTLGMSLPVGGAGGSGALAHLLRFCLPSLADSWAGANNAGATATDLLDVGGREGRYAGHGAGDWVPRPHVRVMLAERVLVPYLQRHSAVQLAQAVADPSAMLLSGLPVPAGVRAAPAAAGHATALTQLVPALARRLPGLALPAQVSSGGSWSLIAWLVEVARRPELPPQADMGCDLLLSGHGTAQNRGHIVEHIATSRVAWALLAAVFDCAVAAKEARTLLLTALGESVDNDPFLTKLTIQSAVAWLQTHKLMQDAAAATIMPAGSTAEHRLTDADRFATVYSLRVGLARSVYMALVTAIFRTQDKSKFLNTRLFNPPGKSGDPLALWAALADGTFLPLGTESPQDATHGEVGQWDAALAPLRFGVSTGVSTVQVPSDFLLAALPFVSSTGARRRHYSEHLWSGLRWMASRLGAGMGAAAGSSALSHAMQRTLAHGSMRVFAEHGSSQSQGSSQGSPALERGTDVQGAAPPTTTQDLQEDAAADAFGNGLEAVWTEVAPAVPSVLSAQPLPTGLGGGRYQWEMSQLGCSPALLLMLRVLDHMTDTYAMDEGWLPVFETDCGERAYANGYKEGCAPDAGDDDDDAAEKRARGALRRVLPSDKAMPAWMAHLVTALSSPLASVRARAAIVQLLVQRPYIFAPWAGAWTKPLLQCIAQLCRLGDSASGAMEPFNHAIHDACGVFVKWQAGRPRDSQDAQCATAVLASLIRSTPQPMASVWTAKLRLVKELMGVWLSPAHPAKQGAPAEIGGQPLWRAVRIDKSMLFSSFQGRDGRSSGYLSMADRTFASSLAVVAALVRWEVPAFDCASDARPAQKLNRVSDLVGALSACMAAPARMSRQVYLRVAELIGLVAGQVQRGVGPGWEGGGAPAVHWATVYSSGDWEALCGHVRKALKALHNKPPKDDRGFKRRFIECTRMLALRCPGAVDALIVQNAVRMLGGGATYEQDNIGQCVVDIVQSFCASDSGVGDALMLLQPAFPTLFRPSASHELQGKVLLMLGNAVRSRALSPAAVDAVLLPAGQGGLDVPQLLLGHDRVSCRAALFEFAFAVVASSEHCSAASVQCALSTLLAGCFDPDATLKTQVETFWENGGALHEVPQVRLLQLLQFANRNNYGALWSQFAASSLLRLALHGDAASRERLSGTPLAPREHRSKVQSINTAWNGTRPERTLLQGATLGGGGSQDQGGQLLATQDYGGGGASIMFSQTQAVPAVDEFAFQGTFAGDGFGFTQALEGGGSADRGADAAQAASQAISTVRRLARTNASSGTGGMPSLAGDLAGETGGFSATQPQGGAGASLAQSMLQADAGKVFRVRFGPSSVQAAATQASQTQSSSDEGGAGGSSGSQRGGSSSGDRHWERALQQRQEHSVVGRAARAQAGRSVRLLRSYRAGDLPDIEVPKTQLLLPLRQLLGQDAPLAQTVLAALSEQLYGAATVQGRAGGVRSPLSVFAAARLAMRQLSNDVVHSATRNPATMGGLTAAQDAVTAMLALGAHVTAVDCCPVFRNTNDLQLQLPAGLAPALSEGGDADPAALDALFGGGQGDGRRGGLASLGQQPDAISPVLAALLHITTNSPGLQLRRIDAGEREALKHPKAFLFRPAAVGRAGAALSLQLQCKAFLECCLRAAGHNGLFTALTDSRGVRDGGGGGSHGSLASEGSLSRGDSLTGDLRPPRSQGRDRSSATAASRSRPAPSAAAPSANENALVAAAEEGDIREARLACAGAYDALGMPDASAGAAALAVTTAASAEAQAAEQKQHWAKAAQVYNAAIQSSNALEEHEEIPFMLAAPDAASAELAFVPPGTTDDLECWQAVSSLWEADSCIPFEEVDRWSEQYCSALGKLGDWGGLRQAVHDKLLSDSEHAASEQGLDAALLGSRFAAEPPLALLFGEAVQVSTSSWLKPEDSGEVQSGQLAYLLQCALQGDTAAVGDLQQLAGLAEHSPAVHAWMQVKASLVLACQSMAAGDSSGSARGVDAWLAGATVQAAAGQIGAEAMSGMGVFSVLVQGHTVLQALDTARRLRSHVAGTGFVLGGALQAALQQMCTGSSDAYNGELQHASFSAMARASASAQAHSAVLRALTDPLLAAKRSAGVEGGAYQGALEQRLPQHFLGIAGAALASGLPERALREVARLPGGGASHPQALRIAGQASMQLAALAAQDGAISSSGALLQRAVALTWQGAAGVVAAHSGRQRGSMGAPAGGDPVSAEQAVVSVVQVCTAAALASQGQPAALQHGCLRAALHALTAACWGVGDSTAALLTAGWSSERPSAVEGALTIMSPGDAAGTAVGSRVPTTWDAACDFFSRLLLALQAGQDAAGGTTDVSDSGRSSTAKRSRRGETADAGHGGNGIADTGAGRTAAAVAAAIGLPVPKAEAWCAAQLTAACLRAVSLGSITARGFLPQCLSQLRSHPKQCIPAWVAHGGELSRAAWLQCIEPLVSGFVVAAQGAGGYNGPSLLVGADAYSQELLGCAGDAASAQVFLLGWTLVGLLRTHASAVALPLLVACEGIQLEGGSDGEAGGGGDPRWLPCLTAATPVQAAAPVLELLTLLCEVAPQLQLLVRATRDLSPAEQRISSVARLALVQARRGKHMVAADMLKALYSDLGTAEVCDRTPPGRKAAAGIAAALKVLKPKLQKLLSPRGGGAPSAHDVMVACTAQQDSKLAAALKGHAFAPGKAALGSFSLWMQDFDGRGLRVSGGLTVPQESTNTAASSAPPCRLLSFEPSLLYLQSKQRPCRVGMRGDDGRRHLFLLKQGEDLRLDQRVEDAFGVMNASWRRDGETAAAGLEVPRLAVTPLSRAGGFMEWLGGGETLDQRVATELNASHGSLLQGGDTVMRSKLGKRQLEQLWGGKGLPVAPKDYFDLFLKSDAVVAQAYANACAAVPSTSLQGMVLRMAGDARAYHALRCSLAGSLAATNTACYILGVGDRHLQNIMLVPGRGLVVPIDFGYSFSIGTDTLPVVELYGIRLTPALRAMLAPLHHGRALTLPMARALGAQGRAAQQLLLGLESLVQDPIIDWAYNAHKATVMRAAVQAAQDTQATGTPGVSEVGGTVQLGPSGTVPMSAGPAAGGASAGGGSCGSRGGSMGGASKKRPRGGTPEAEDSNVIDAAWYPLRKLLRVRQKLEHLNPAAVLALEVQDNAIAVQHPRALRALLAVLAGQPEAHVRAGADCNVGPERRCASPLDQAEALVEIATDATLLMRQWHGLWLHV